MKNLNKNVRIIACLLCAALLLSGCTLQGMMQLPSLTSMYGSGTGSAAPAATASQSGDTVTISRQQYERYQQFDELLEIMDVVQAQYYEDVDTSVLLESAAAGLLEGVDDPYTFYYSPAAFKEMWEDDDGKYAGIGIQISINYTTQICTISRVFEGGPAQQAGICRGDILYRVEDLYVTSDNINDAIKMMRREPGTQVNVSFLRQGEEMSYQLTCATVTTNRVESTMMDGQVGYIRLYEFAGDCAEKFAEALEQLTAQGAKGIIIDLRDNGGGWVEDAQSIGDLFMDQGTLCYLEYKDGHREYYKTHDGKTEIPLVVLVNEYSASSSEILTGALRDRADATVVGVKTYGKGIVQQVATVGKKGAGMQVTVAQYFTPNGYAVHKLGITPDVEIQMPEEDVNRIFQLADLEDVQLNKAYETMLQKLAGEPIGTQGEDPEEKQGEKQEEKQGK